MQTKNPLPKRIDELMQEFGFRSDAAESTGRALIVNLVRSAYGPEAAREFIRQMNLVEKPEDKSHRPKTQFEKSLVESLPQEPEQLPLFSGTGTD
jgi:hypothetical protein